MTVAAARPRHSLRPFPRAVPAYTPTAAPPITSVHSPSTSPFVVSRPLQLPRVPTRPESSILTLAAAHAALAVPTSVSSATLAAAHSLVRTVGKPLRLDPRIGEPVAPPPAVTAYAIALDANLAAFASFNAAQSALHRGAHLAGAVLPPHVLVPGVGRWTYVYFLASHSTLFARIVAHLRLIYEDLAIPSAPLPHTASALDSFAAAGVACRLRREALRLVDRRTPTSVPLAVRQALALVLQAHARDTTPTRRPALLHVAHLLM